MRVVEELLTCLPTAGDEIEKQTPTSIEFIFLIPSAHSRQKFFLLLVVADVHGEVLLPLCRIAAVFDITEEAGLNMLSAYVSLEMVFGVESSIAEMARDVLFGAVIGFEVIFQRLF